MTTKNYELWAELAIARLEQYPHDFIFSAGTWEGNSTGLIYEIQKRSKIGEFFVKVEQEYFQAIKRGNLKKILDDPENMIQ